MLSDLFTLAVLAIAAGTAAFTIARTKITAPMRVWVGTRNGWFGSLLNCPYCLSHWFCAVAVAIYRPRITDLNIVLDLGVSWLVAVFVAAMTFGFIARQIKVL